MLILGLVVVILTSNLLASSLEERIDTTRHEISTAQSSQFRMPRMLPVDGSRVIALTGYFMDTYDYWAASWFQEQQVQIQYTYGMKIGELTSSYYDDLGIWIDDTKFTITYNTNNQPSSILISVWYGVERIWVPVTTINYSWDGTRISQISMTDIGSADPMQMTEYFYNEQNRIAYHITQWDNEERPVEISKTSYDYDANGRMITSLYQEMVNDTWAFIDRGVFSYIPEDTSTYQDFVNILIWQWMWHYMELYPYTTKLKLDEELYYSWYNSLWYESKKMEHSYNAANKITQSVESDMMGEWNPVGQIDYSYNAANNLDVLTVSEYFIEDLSPLSRNRYTYGEVSSSQDGLMPEFSSGIAIFPNPFNPETRISFKVDTRTEVSVQIFNLKGQLIRSLYNGSKPAGDHIMKWDGRDDRGDEAGSGIYIVRLKTSGGVRSARAILLK